MHLTIKYKNKSEQANHLMYFLLSTNFGLDVCTLYTIANDKQMGVRVDPEEKNVIY